MHTYDLRTATLNDIVFEGRNKAYGAFVLRQLYHRHLARALAIAVTLSLLLISSPLIYEALFPTMTIAPAIGELPDETTILIAPPKVVPDQPAAGGAPVKRVKVPPVVIPTIPTQVVPDERFKKQNEVQPVAPEVGPVAEIDMPSSNNIGTEVGTGQVADGTSDIPVETPAPDKPFITAEVMPQFVGGQEALMRYMQKNLRYPPQALRNGVDGRVFISFTIQADGSIADVEVVKGLGFGTDEEAARVVKNMPPWTPGRQNKHNVAVRYTMPITFRYE